MGAFGLVSVFVSMVKARKPPQMASDDGGLLGGIAVSNPKVEWADRRNAHMQHEQAARRLESAGGRSHTLSCCLLLCSMYGYVCEVVIM